MFTLPSRLKVVIEKVKSLRGQKEGTLVKFTQIDPKIAFVLKDGTTFAVITKAEFEKPERDQPVTIANFAKELKLDLQYVKGHIKQLFN